MELFKSHRRLVDFKILKYKVLVERYLPNQTQIIGITRSTITHYVSDSKILFQNTERKSVVTNR